MPAAEQTWRDTKLLHKIFGATSFVMLVATIWMFAADHTREWKPIQRTSDNIEVKMTQWRELQYQTEDAVQQRRLLVANLAAARRQPIPTRLLDQFEQEVHSVPETQNVSFAEVRELAAEIEANAPAAGAEGAVAASEEEEERQEEAEESREELLEELRDIIRRARHREDNLLSQRKFKSADRDAAVATHGLMVRDNRPQEEQDAQQRSIDQITVELNELTVKYQQAKEHRATLDRIVKEITKEEDAARDALVKSESDLKQLNEAQAQRTSTYINWFGWAPLPGKKFLELPILDAFNSPRKIENLWSDGLEIDYNFSKVRRFDRCTTCHQAMQKTAPGSAIEPAYEGETLLDFQLAVATEEEETPAEPVADGADAPAAPEEAPSAAKQLEDQLGLRIAEAGLIERHDATVQFIRPESPAAAASTILNPEVAQINGDELRKGMLQGHGASDQVKPGLQVGDVIVAVNGDPVMEPRKVTTILLDKVRDGKAFTVTVRRGLPNPYTSHPRLDLFVGSLSPHKMSDFACTICHQGQGSATAFKFASHTPDTEQERKDWVFDHGWFDNLHWIYPMYPERFAESVCLKCHHTVTELESSPDFPETSAPKVVQGYHLIRKYGCYGCHEINGYDGPRRIGPDLRLEPNVFAAALQLRADPGFEKLSTDEQQMVNELVDHPDRDALRHRVLEMLELDARSEEPRISQESLVKLTPLFRDIESPGSLRKAGPSLRHVSAKLDNAFLYDWIREPKHFRPSTRMPQFFGLVEHLKGSKGVDDALELEPIEILGLTTFLQARSQPFEYLAPPEGVTEAADAERGRIAFQTRGCLACHSHKEFADAEQYRTPGEIVQGPDLSGVGDKFAGENQRKWLYSWIRQPSLYHARTVMPDLFLDPIETKDGDRSVVTDPVADIVAFLVNSSKTGWQPKPDTLTEAADADPKQLDRFVRLNLVDTFSEARADQFMKEGIPESMRGELKGAEVELIVPDAQRSAAGFQLSAEQKLMYIGSKTISKYGCYGCHDVPGFEDAKPIGTVLADWGRKDSAKLAFEHITHYIEHGHGHGGGAHGDAGHAAADHSESGAGTAAHDHHEGSGKGADLNAGVPPHANESETDREYYVSLLKSANRAGFLWQKLLEPRSYDYHKTENKKYSERLRMPQFPFTAEEREAVITFVLGLVADPPNSKYVYQPSERTEAVLAGRAVLEKYNCGGCHVLSPEQWDVLHQPEYFGEQSPVKIYPYLQTHFTPEQLAASAQANRSGLAHATLEGIPAVDDSGLPIAYDDAGDPLEADLTYDPSKVEYSFELWRPTAIDGHPYEVGVLPLNVPANMIQKRRGTEGGFLARYLVPQVVALEKQVNPAAKGTEAWGWLPPPLHHEGEKVQTDWLHSFLLNPYAIRPATFLRMPKFNMTPLEATQLVNYFAAMDNAEYPYAFSTRRQSEHLRRMQAAYEQQGGDEPPANRPAADGQPAGNQGAAGAAAAGQESEGSPRTRLEDAMRIVVNNNYCVKCHLVGDFEPAGSDRAKAPNLAEVYRRLRPDYLRNWIANPKTYLPYTSMPVNIPYDPDLPHLGGVDQGLFHGTSIEQVDGIVDLLMNFDEFAKQRSSVETLVKEMGGPAAPADGAPAAPAADAPAADAPATSAPAADAAAASGAGGDE